METGERHGADGASPRNEPGLDEFRDLALEYDEKARTSIGALEAPQLQNNERASDGLNEFRGRVEDHYPEEHGGDPVTKEAPPASEAPATVGEESTLETEPAAVQARPELHVNDLSPDRVAGDSAQQVEPGPRVDPVGPDEHVGRYILHDNPMEVTEREAPPKTEPELETDGLHGFPAEAKIEPEAEEVRTLEAVDYGKGAVLRVPKSDLEEAGFEPEAGQNSIVELGLKNVDNEEVEIVFARYVASDRRAEAYVGDIGGTKGSKYELVEASEHDEDKFAKDFERGKCEHIQNVSLEHVDNKMFVEVDNRKVELEDYQLATSGSHIVMRGQLGGDSDCKIEFDGRRASVKFGRDYHVEEMRMEGDDLVVRYVQSRNERYERRIPLEHHESPGRPSLSQLDKEEMKEHVKMFDRPERIEGVYQFVIDRASSAEAQRLLTEAGERGDNDYGMMKAEISERLVPNMLEIAGWERIKWHPFNDTEREGANAPGTDWLMRTPDGKEVLVEIKWYENTRDAIRKATTQVEKDFREHRDDPDLKLEGAYIAIVDYDEDSKDGGLIKVHVLRVHSKEELR